MVPLRQNINVVYRFQPARRHLEPTTLRAMSSSVSVAATLLVMPMLVP